MQGWWVKFSITTSSQAQLKNTLRVERISQVLEVEKKDLTLSLVALSSTSLKFSQCLDSPPKSRKQSDGRIEDKFPFEVMRDHEPMWIFWFTIVSNIQHNER